MAQRPRLLRAIHQQHLRHVCHERCATHTHTHRVSERERDRQNFTECKSHGHFFIQTAQSFLRTKTDAPRGAPRRLVEHPDDGELQPRPADRSTWEARPNPGAPGQHVRTPLKQSCSPATHPAVIWYKDLLSCRSAGTTSRTPPHGVTCAAERNGRWRKRRRRAWSWALW